MLGILGRPKRFMDGLREDITAVEVTESDAEERTEWRRRLRCGDPQREQPKEDRHIIDSGTVGQWDSGAVGQWDSGTVGQWDSGTVGQYHTHQ